MSLKPHKINTDNNFISGWYLGDVSLCDELIQFFNESPDKNSGLMTGYLGKGNVDTGAKDSMDLNLPPGDLANRYILKLNEVARQYIGQYEYAGKLVPWGVVEPIAIQHYQPDGGFKIWHFERDNTNAESVNPPKNGAACKTMPKKCFSGCFVAWYQQFLTEH
jgi:hypothetical protein